MRDHAICRAQTVWNRLVISQQDLTDFNERKIVLAHGVESLFHLVESGNETTQEPARFEGGAYLRNVVIRIRHIEEERVRISFVKALSDVAQFEIHA